MGGIVDGLKWGIILNLAAVVILPLATRFLGTGAHPGGRPFGYDFVHHPSCDDPGSNCTGGFGYFCSEEGYCGGGGGGQGQGSGGGGHGKKKKKHGHGGGGHGGGYW